MATHLVTGGAGFIGSSIAEALLSKGERVRILDDFSSGRRQNLESLKGDVEVIEGSIVDAATVTRVMNGVEVDPQNKTATAGGEPAPGSK